MLRDRKDTLVVGDNMAHVDMLLEDAEDNHKADEDMAVAGELGERQGWLGPERAQAQALAEQALSLVQHFLLVCLVAGALLPVPLYSMNSAEDYWVRLVVSPARP